VKVSQKQWDDLNNRLSIAIRDIDRLVQIVRQDRAVLQYIANRDTTVDGLITITPVTSFPLYTGSDATGIISKKPMDFVKTTVSALFEHPFGSAVVP